MKKQLLCALVLICTLTYQLQAQNWNEIIKATASDAAAADEFGWSVAIDGDYAIVGAYRDDDDGSASGSAYIFVKSGTTWTQQQKLTASDAAAGDLFGVSVSISGDYAIVGAWQDDDDGSNSGSAYVFTRSGTTWTQQQKLTASDGAGSDLFGYSVSISGDYAIVGAWQDDDAGSVSGSAYIYVRSGTTWTQQQKLTASDAAAGDLFGVSVSISGDTAIVGAYGNDDDGSNSGSAYVFLRSGTTWTQQQKLTASDAAAGDLFGFSVSISGDTAIVGAYQDDDDGGNSGSAYVFTRSGTTWTEQQKLTASDAVANNFFGWSVSISGDTTIVGAVLADNEDDIIDSGAAYVFTRSGTTWTEQQKLTASDAAGNDEFGSIVSISGDNAIVGARGNDDNGGSSGSAYFFDRELAITYTFNNAWLPSDPDGVATALDELIIEAGDATLTSATAANTVTIDAGASLTVNDGLTATEVTLNSTSTSYASLITGPSGSVSGTISYNRFVNSNILGNDLVSAPLAGQTWAEFLDPNNATALFDDGGAPITYAFAPFDKTTGDFENYNTNTTANLTSGVGYRAATDTGATLAFSGTIPANVSVNIVDSNTAFSEWNLVGNPYPAYLNVQAFLNHQVDTGVDNIDLLFDPAAAIYGYDGDAQNGWTIYNLSNTSTSTVMAPGQGFFVAAAAANVGAYDLQFTTDMQSTGSSDDFIVGRNAEFIYLTVGLTANAKAYSTDIYFNDNASLGLDKGYDAALWGTEAPEFSIYSHLVNDNLGRPIALQALSATDLTQTTIPLGVNANQGEQITFSISETTLPESVNVYLEDVLTNTITLLNTSDYVITPTSDLSGTGRFFLRLSEDALSTIDNDFDTLTIFALNNSKEVVVSGLLKEATNFELYDIQGRQVLSTELDHSTLDNRVDVSALSGGVYVVSVANNTQQKSQKVIIK